MQYYIAHHPEIADWVKIESKARREIKKRFGIKLALKRDLKPHGTLRRKYGQYSIHLNTDHGCVVKNLTIEMLRDQLDNILDSIPAPVLQPSGHYQYPTVDWNRD